MTEDRDIFEEFHKAVKNKRAERIKRDSAARNRRKAAKQAKYEHQRKVDEEYEDMYYKDYN